MKETIYQYLAQSGMFESRKAILRALKKGKVTVDDRKVTKPNFQFNPNMKRVICNGKFVNRLELAYYVINKPVGYVSQKNDQQKRPYVLDLLKGKIDVKILNSLALAGRLDVDTSGLMIATNDGDFIHAIMHPKNKVIKKYEVELDKEIREQDIQKVKHGVIVRAPEETYKASAQIYSAKDKRLMLGIAEGRKRQIRLMFKVIGYEVKMLKRVAIGRLERSDLKVGDFMKITSRELKFI